MRASACSAQQARLVSKPPARVDASVWKGVGDALEALPVWLLTLHTGLTRAAADAIERGDAAVRDAVARVLRLCVREELTHLFYPTLADASALVLAAGDRDELLVPSLRALARVQHGHSNQRAVFDLWNTHLVDALAPVRARVRGETREALDAALCAGLFGGDVHVQQITSAADHFVLGERDEHEEQLLGYGWTFVQSLESRQTVIDVLLRGFAAAARTVDDGGEGGAEPARKKRKKKKAALPSHRSWREVAFRFFEVLLAVAANTQTREGLLRVLDEQDVYELSRDRDAPQNVVLQRVADAAVEHKAGGELLALLQLNYAFLEPHLVVIHGMAGETALLVALWAAYAQLRQVPALLEAFAQAVRGGLTRPLQDVLGSEAVLGRFLTECPPAQGPHLWRALLSAPPNARATLDSVSAFLPRLRFTDHAAKEVAALCEESFRVLVAGAAAPQSAAVLRVYRCLREIRDRCDVVLHHGDGPRQPARFEGDDAIIDAAETCPPDADDETAVEAAHMLLQRLLDGSATGTKTLSRLLRLRAKDEPNEARWAFTKRFLVRLAPLLSERVARVVVGRLVREANAELLCDVRLLEAPCVRAVAVAAALGDGEASPAFVLDWLHRLPPAFYTEASAQAAVDGALAMGERDVRLFRASRRVLCRVLPMARVFSEQLWAEPPGSDVSVLAPGLDAAAAFHGASLSRCQAGIETAATLVHDSKSYWSQCLLAELLWRLIALREQRKDDHAEAQHLHQALHGGKTSKTLRRAFEEDFELTAGVIAVLDRLDATLQAPVSSPTAAMLGAVMRLSAPTRVVTLVGQAVAHACRVIAPAVCAPIHERRLCARLLGAFAASVGSLEPAPSTAQLEAVTAAIVSGMREAGPVQDMLFDAFCTLIDRGPVDLYVHALAFAETALERRGDVRAALFALRGCVLEGKRDALKARLVRVLGAVASVRATNRDDLVALERLLVLVLSRHKALPMDTSTVSIVYQGLAPLLGVPGALPTVANALIACVKHRTQLVFKTAPTFASLVRACVRLVTTEAATTTTDLELVCRLLEEMGKGAHAKALSRYTVGVLHEFFESGYAEASPLLPVARNVLVPGVMAVMTLCSEHEFKQLHATLTLVGGEAFKHTYSAFKATFQYKGK